MAGIDSLGGAPQQRVDAAAKALEARLQGELPAEAPAPVEPHDHEQTLRERPVMMASAGISGIARHVIVEGADLEATEDPALGADTPRGPSPEAWNAAANSLGALADRLEDKSLSAAERLAASKEFLGHAAGFLEGFEESLRAVDPETTPMTGFGPTSDAGMRRTLEQRNQQAREVSKTRPTEAAKGGAPATRTPAKKGAPTAPRRGPWPRLSDAKAVDFARDGFEKEAQAGFKSPDRISRKEAQEVLQETLRLAQSGVTRLDSISHATGGIAESRGIFNFAAAVSRAHRGLQNLVRTTWKRSVKKEAQSLVADFEELDLMLREISAGVLACQMGRSKRAIDPDKIKQWRDKQA